MADTELLASRVVEEGILRPESKGDPYGEKWVQVEGEQRRIEFAKMLDTARESLTSGGEFILPFVGRRRDTLAYVGFYTINDLNFSRTGRFEEVAGILRPHQDNGYLTEGLHALKHLMFKHFGALHARGDVYEHNERVIKIMERLGYTLVGSHVSTRPGYEQPTLEFEIAAKDWPRISAKRSLPIEIEGLDELKCGIHPSNDLLSRLNHDPDNRHEKPTVSIQPPNTEPSGGEGLGF